MMPINPSPEALAKALYDAITSACLYIQHEPTRDAVLEQIVDTQRKLNNPLMIATTEGTHKLNTKDFMEQLERRT